MTRTLTAEHLNQIKADIAARKAMPEYGESVEGNIERLRVIGATRSHFSTETVEVLVRALEEKMRALADAERERDDWVEHSRRMEYRAIEAKELLANREAQPVGFRYRHKDTVSWLYNDWRWPDSVEVEQCQIEWLYTAPPAPAVPPEATPDSIENLLADITLFFTAGSLSHGGSVMFAEVWNACRAAMLENIDKPAPQLDSVVTRHADQPVSSGYKLVPAEATEDMIAAAMNCDDASFNADETFCVNFGNIYAAMLAAVPEGGNGA